ncbi:MAG: hypothetical protein [Bacteriophage sp.]|nr:MAG: hypothetical protein [Bacteriophage sp.]
MSRFEPTLRELAMEPDEDKRLELAAAIDDDAADLDERWDEREAMKNERDRLAAERDEAVADRDKYRDEVEGWKKRYADRFFTAPNETIHDQVQDIKRDGTVQSFDQLWESREG